MNDFPPEYSDYIVYVDESGDHSIASINPRYPLFVLSFCIIQKNVYTHNISPALRTLKFSVFGHDMIIFHEHEIRKKLGAFSTLGKAQRERLLESLSHIIAQSDFTIVPIIVDKLALKGFGIDLPHLYHLVVCLKNFWSNFGAKARIIAERKLACIALIHTNLRSLRSTILRSFRARNCLKNF